MLTKADVATPDDVDARQTYAANRFRWPCRVRDFRCHAVRVSTNCCDALMRHIENNRESLANDIEMSAAEAALDADIAGDVLRQSLLRRPQRPSEHAAQDIADANGDAEDDDDEVEVIYRAE